MTAATTPGGGALDLAATAAASCSPRCGERQSQFGSSATACRLSSHADHHGHTTTVLHGHSLKEHLERKHHSHRAPWLRAFVLGASDGLVSTAALLTGVGAAHMEAHMLVTTGVAGADQGCGQVGGGCWYSSSLRDASTHQATQAWLLAACPWRLESTSQSALRCKPQACKRIRCCYCQHCPAFGKGGPAPDQSFRCPPPPAAALFGAARRRASRHRDRAARACDTRGTSARAAGAYVRRAAKAVFAPPPLPPKPHQVRGLINAAASPVLVARPPLHAMRHHRTLFSCPLQADIRGARAGLPAGSQGVAEPDGHQSKWIQRLSPGAVMPAHTALLLRTAPRWPQR